MNFKRPFDCLWLAAAFIALAAPAAFAQSTGGNSLDYSAFKIVADRNIFDPNRYPHTPGRQIHRQTKTTDTFSLVGVMSYQKGTFAFFDGTSADYRKVIQAAGSIAGFTLVEVAPDKVRLASGTNTFTVPVGGQLRFEDGEWVLNTNSESVSGYTQSASSTETSPSGASDNSDSSASTAASGGAASDVLKRLMERRQQELNR